jgi:glycosyltransferase involved in cell wall biosynthesis
VPSIVGKRVVIVLGPLELGGSERQALLFARYLKEQHADVHVWGTMGAPGRLAALCDDYAIPWRIVSEPWVYGRNRRLRALKGFASQLRRARVDILLPYMEMPNLVCGIVWRFTGAKVCVWNQRDDGVARIRTRYERIAIRSTPRFISNSTHGAEHLIRDRGVSAARVRVIHNGIELSPALGGRTAWRTRLRLSEQTFAVVMVANLTQFKDHATLLRGWRIAVDKLQAENRTAVLLLAGRKDEMYDSLIAQTNELGVSDTVMFLGQVSDVSGLLSSVDAGVFCSKSEGSPNSVLEYMAAGLPVTGTDIPAMREGLPSASHGLLAAVGDSQSLASHLVRLAEDEDLRARVGQLNRQRIETEFTPARMCEETVSVIEQML